jgi:hypothetical protein
MTISRFHAFLLALGLMLVGIAVARADSLVRFSDGLSAVAPHTSVAPMFVDAPN